MTHFIDLFHIDRLSFIVISLIIFMGILIGGFSTRYLQGDSRYRIFFGQFTALIFSLIVMMASNHLLLFLLAWTSSNFLLTRLMIHKSSWPAALASGRFAAKHFFANSLCLSIAFCILYKITGTAYIDQLLKLDLTSAAHRVPIIMALIFMFIAALLQSSIWPFHRWIISSLNSPTPVSALMHAGLINGGGVLLVRFAPLYLQFPDSLNLLFVFGILTALLGTYWKLMQHDIKRLLACSTMAQMGFMMAQCGLGLFPAAVAHLCWHGMFKASLFLAAGAAGQEKRFDTHYAPHLPDFIMALCCGAVSAFCFNGLTHQGNLWDTHLILVILAGLAGARVTLPFLQKSPFKRLPLALCIAVLIGGFYGLSVEGFSLILEPLNIMKPQPLNILHEMGVVALIMAWLGMIFGHSMFDRRSAKFNSWQKRLYIHALNSSQPHPTTVTTHRTQYHYK